MADPVATVALVVALFALLVALLQVLQQYAATADGYRRCQRPVIGGWACYTKRKARFDQLRFETIFAVPIIFLRRRDREECPIKGRTVIDITGTAESCRSTLVSQFLEETILIQESIPNENGRYTQETLIEDGIECSRQKSSLVATKSGSRLIKPGCFQNPNPHDQTTDNELVSWIYFLETLQWNQTIFSTLVQSGFQPDLAPAIQVSRRSWDFVPPDVIKPYAVTNVGDIAIIIQRLGMSWKEFDPGKGVMRAEGNNYLVTSTVVRSLGILLSFAADSHLISHHERLKNIYVPSWQASLLGFGLVPRSELAPNMSFGRSPHNAFPVGKADLFDFYLKSFSASTSSGRDPLRDDSFSGMSSCTTLCTLI
ncbi:hypothetical protein CLAIMM_15171 isoform 1 [Cladophialophora immunda]|nr:hypothetical protein CLAIMM_15171 isoform 1 [Cladophialophora immunda]